MYLKKQRKLLQSSNNQQLSLNFKNNNQAEILRFKPTRSKLAEKPIINQEQVKAQESDSNNKKNLVRPIVNQDQDIDLDDSDNSSEIEELIVAIEEDSKAPIKGTIVPIQLQQEARMDAVSEIISSLKHDLRHERMIKNADWESGESLDWEHFAHSADYSAFLNSYE